MFRVILAASCLSVLVLGIPHSLRAGEAERDLPSETLAVFSNKCAICHGPNLAKPKGRFGYVLDLARIANNREMVVPSSPDESELWDLVKRGEMPPPESPGGPLSAAQKETIRAWIAAGAPATGTKSATLAPQDAAPQEEIAAVPAPRHWLSNLGRMHVVIVHFPIALLIAAVMGEAWSLWRGSRTPAQSVRFCVLIGTAGALAAAALGWLQAWSGYGIGMPRILDLHRWLGTATAIWAIGTVLLSEWDVRRGLRSHWFRAWSMIGALLVGISGHLGGVLVHGEDFFTGG